MTIRLVIVDDAFFIREGLKRLLAGYSGIDVVGTASSGLDLIAHLDEWRPDVITLDINMPGMDGLTTLDRLMQIRPLPVIILSTRSGVGAPLTLEALARGAVDFVDKEAYSLVDFEALRTVLVEKIRSVTALTVDGGPWTDKTVSSPVQPQPVVQREHLSTVHRAPSTFSLAVIGASTGGPRAIETVLKSIGPELAVPLLVVQHMPAGFTRAFAERLDRALPFRVREGVAGEPLEPGCVYIAPGGLHMAVSEGAEPRVALSGAVHGTLHTPSVDELFVSAGKAYGGRVVAALLTGMGRDGARGMAALAQSGAHTIAQSEESCVVYGMPRAAVEAGAAREVLPLESIGPRLRTLLSGSDPHQEN